MGLSHRTDENTTQNQLLRQFIRNAEPTRG